MSELSNACKDARVSQAACQEAAKIEKLASREEFYRPSYPVERNDAFKPLQAEINSLSAAELKDVAKVHERLIARSYAPPQNGGVEFDEKGNISGLTFGTWQNHIDVSYQPNDK